MVYIKTLTLVCILIQIFTTTVHADIKDDTQMLHLIKACADIGDYDVENSDIDELMRRFLYTYRNFEIVSDIEPHAVQSGKLIMCNKDFVKDAFYKTFRLNAPEPAPDRLTDIGYCVNNGFYCFSGGYTEYFATDVKEITRVIPLNDNSVYVIFSDYYRSGTNEPVFEYSSMIIGKDSEGYFVKRIKMNDDFKDLHSLLNTEDVSQSAPDKNPYIPIAVIAVTLLSSIAVFYIYFIRK